MSVWAKKWAYEQHPRRIDENGRLTDKKHPAAKAVLVALAEFPGPGQQDCWPSQETLAAMTDFTERQVRACLRDLEAQGLIRRTPRRRKDGSRRSDRITLLGPPAAFGPGVTDAQPEESSGSTSNQPEERSGYQPEESSGHEPLDNKNRKIRASKDSLRSSLDATALPSPPGNEEEVWPGDDSSLEEKQHYFMAYLYRRLKERNLLEKKTLTDSYRKQFVGEVRNHINAGHGRAEILRGIDYIVFRWPVERVGLRVGMDRASRQDNVRHLPPRREEPYRRKKRVI